MSLVLRQIRLLLFRLGMTPGLVGVRAHHRACELLPMDGDIDYAGTRCNPSTNDEALPQALAWPRSGASCDGVEATCSFIPKEIKEAQILIAHELVVDPGLITGTPGGGGTPAGVYVSKQQLGTLVQEFSEYTNSDSASSNECSDCATPAIISALPWLKGLLSCWADVGTGSSKILLRVRS